MVDPIDDASEAPAAPESGRPRQCVACGYLLFGLGDEPRCPECGLVNIPEGFRRQVWELVDSGKWFFSGFFSPFRRRLPGWWWALDRPGDVRRSVRFAAMRVAVCGMILFAAIMGAECIRLQMTHASCVSTDDPGVFLVKGVAWEYGFLGWYRSGHDLPDRPAEPGECSAWPNLQWKTGKDVRWVWSAEGIRPALYIWVWIVATWAGPAAVGIWTQIRRGLPSFARAPRTILAASMYESHRLIYLALAILLWAGLEVLYRARLFDGTVLPFPARIPGFLVPVSLFLLITLFGAAGWAGPVRSDYTRQLIRSRFHAGRIIVMYAIILPGLLTLLLAAIFELLLGE